VVVLPVQRSSRQTEAQTPLLLSPRNSLIADRQPTFHWQAVPGASGYGLSLNIPNAENWEVETTETTLPYPTDKAPLPAGSTNIFLATLDNPTEAEEAFVDVMDEAAQADLVASEAEIRNLGVDETAQAYLLAQLYRQREMKAAAIAQLEQITANGQAISADLWQQLGDLYFESGLYTQAEEKYKNALSAASANDDQQAQAAAYFGLGQTAYVFEEDEQALDYLDQAEALYRQTGDDVLAEQVSELKQKIEK
jgi:tetratricopeptide (TPR) repeat protein